MNNSIKYGFYLALTLVVYFVFIDGLGFADKIYFSFFNAILTGGSIYLAIKDVYKKQGDSFKYMDGYQAALVAGLIGSTLFTVFMAVYLFELRPELAVAIKSQIKVAGGIEAALLLFTFLSGIATSIVAALVIIPIFKKTWNIQQVR